MLDPWDILYGDHFDAMSSALDDLLNHSVLSFGWFAPPCTTFSPLRNLDPGGPLRPPHNLLGSANDPKVNQGNMFWRRTLFLCARLLERNIDIAIEHPHLSIAWRLPETIQFAEKYKLRKVRFDQCMFQDETPLHQKSTLVLTSASWIAKVSTVCDHSHQHGQHLRGSAAKKAAAYPLPYCEALARSYGESPGH